MFCRKYTLCSDRMLSRQAQGPPHDHPANIYRVERKTQLALPRQVSALNKTTHMCKGRHTGITFPKLLHTTAYEKKCTTRERCQFLKPKKLSVNYSDIMERSGAYITLHYLFFFFCPLSTLAVFPKQSPKLFFIFSAPTHKKDRIFKIPRGRK